MAVTWQPNALEPVFYGVREYGTAAGAPCPVRVFFPSLDGSPDHAAIFAAREPYPLIVLAHGQCGADVDHYRKWQLLPSRLARAGYVVAVPQLQHASSPLVNDADLNRLQSTAAWLRTRWEHRARIAASPPTGLIGHSYGAVLAGRLAALSPKPPVNAPVGSLLRSRLRIPPLRIPPRGPALRMRVGAFASLGGDWHSGLEVAESLTRAEMPKLLVRGTGFTEFGTDIDGYFARFKPAKHSAKFHELEHWDYLLRGSETSRCATVDGICRDYTFVIWDLVTMFFGRYLRAPAARTVLQRIPSSLLPPALDLTREQEFFAGSYLDGFTRLARADANCSVTVEFDASGQRGTFTRQGGRTRAAS